ncbi:DinB family protein [Pimelobacter simplex]|uniref:DinB family protein n=1 Tax=Nocardioides simplex TaxID=2045 RepID=UPI003AAD62F1
MSEPPLAADEATMLRAFLDDQRATLVRQTDGLDAEQLGRRVPPTTMTLGGMLKHLAYVEDWWFGVTLAGAPPHPPFEQVDWRHNRDWDWTSAADDDPAALRRLLREAIVRSDAILDGVTDLDAFAARRHRRGGAGISVRWILIHMIEEYARHCGHADLLREAIDGTTGL